MCSTLKVILTNAAFAMLVNSCVATVSEQNDPFEGLKKKYELAFRNLPIGLQEDARLLVVS